VRPDHSSLENGNDVCKIDLGTIRKILLMPAINQFFSVAAETKGLYQISFESLIKNMCRMGGIC
jgi:hypothetical protein